MLTVVSGEYVASVFRFEDKFEQEIRTLLAACFVMVSWLSYSLTLKMELMCPSETSVLLQQTTRCYIPEDRTLHNHRCENLDVLCSRYVNFKISKILCRVGGTR
jgi:hypothetical protein